MYIKQCIFATEFNLKCIMSSLLEELLGYFNNTSKEEIEKDWELIHREYSYGAEVSSYLESLKEVVSSVDHEVGGIVFEHIVSEDYCTNLELSMAA